jgi:nucleoside-diphosphate-sugar epimerase
VRALARSQRSAGRVAELGAEPARGELSDREALRAGADGCELAFHAAAKVEDWGSWEDFERVNVSGTRNVVEACREVGVRRFVHVSTEAVLIADEPLVDVDETAPRRPDSKAHYPRSKALAEQAVLDAAGDGFEPVAVRPRFVWGAGDQTVLPEIIEMVRAGRFAWIGRGRHLTDTTHVDNVVHGLRLAAEKGGVGEIYFITDGEPVVFREFVSDLIRTQGMEPPERSIPIPVAGAVAAGGEVLWRALRLRGSPPLTRFNYWVSHQQCTIDISKARRELGYEPVRDRESGLAELTGQGAAPIRG